MFDKLNEFFKDAKKSGKDWLKSQLIMSAITFVLAFVGLMVVDTQIVNVGNVIGIFFISLGLAIVDFIPVIGVSACMLPWAVIAALASSTKLGISIFVLFIIVMIIKQILEPLVRGKSLGISPIEEIISSILGFVVCGMNAIGFIIGPLVYIVGKTTYKKFSNNASFEKDKTGGFFQSGDAGAKSNRTDNQSDDVIDISDDIVDVDNNKNK